ncbi:protein jag [Clostridium botulinum]|uniref:RNA-binding protein KhpB n=1 Tax=Clostridium botulinum (strain Eklund 17B / Type B) TaxID=935198 RepID=B2TRI1_CLOBB|nr:MULTISPECIES: RNA-binding cell elongation regulator Jag/EloR [Clostridium]ACD24732.1 R3H domain protein [Clostridium botulinum B str. Eklund 17B (NRP)]AIY80507.1 putative RNA-binding protein [Clostridium botulinum 202F]KAI3344547.1 protein jag [Clostridium botulinum]KFX57451.1 DNA-binding protein [Clostridium botulinum]KON14770.1 DNA-binding protein [Clostridium botulinum]
MRSVELEGKNVEEALNKALLELNTTKDMVDVEVLQRGSKGLFGFISTKRAKIKVTLKHNYIDDIRNFINKILDSMSIKAEIDINEQDDVINISLSGDKLGLLIGYRGETLDSLQCLISLMINKDSSIQYKRIVLDIENYRKKREETLKNVANKTAEKVKRTGRLFRLEPMNPYERRIIHSALQDNSFVNTYSEGKEPFRRVVVELKKN